MLVITGHSGLELATIEANILAKADAVIAKAMRLWTGFNGGYFCLADSNSGLPVLMRQFGEVPAMQGSHWVDACLKGSSLLKCNPSFSLVSQIYPGGSTEHAGTIRGRHYLLALAGNLKGLQSEAVMLALGVESDELMPDLATHLVTKSRNEFFFQALQSAAPKQELRFCE